MYKVYKENGTKLSRIKSWKNEERRRTNRKHQEVTSKIRGMIRLIRQQERINNKLLKMLKGMTVFSRFYFEMGRRD